jgi:hypothetical protein
VLGGAGTVVRDGIGDVVGDEGVGAGTMVGGLITLTVEVVWFGISHADKATAAATAAPVNPPSIPRRRR